MKKSLIIVLVSIVCLFSSITPVYAEDSDMKLVADDASAGDRFGWSIAATEGLIVVGAWADDDNGESSGAAYVFSFTGTAWEQVAKLTPDDGAAGDRFGWSVDIDGNVVVVGAWEDDDNGTSSGSAYIFSGTGTGWTQTAKLIPGDGAEGDEFGYSVAVYGDTVAVGAPADDDNGQSSGSVYVFGNGGGNWEQVAKLIAGDGLPGDTFGNSVDVAAGTIVVGARYADDYGTSSGSSYVFGEGESGWNQIAKLIPNDGAAGDRFGWSVAIDGNTIVVGAWEDDDNGLNSGSAYVFADSGGGWIQTAKLNADDGTAGEEFGYSVGISEGTIVIGAPADDDNGDSSGSAYVFQTDGVAWEQAAKLTAFDGVFGDAFGNAVGAKNSSVVIGARYDDDAGESSGSVYVYPFSVTYFMESLSDEVADIEISENMENHLNNKIDAAVNAITDSNDNNDHAAIKALEAFIKQVEAQRGKKISEEDADTLIAQAEAIIAMLQS
jgi:hypothetical protein